MASSEMSRVTPAFSGRPLARAGHRHVRRVWLPLVAAALSLACASTPKAERMVEPCDGYDVLVVSNQTGVPIEVFQVQGTNTTPIGVARVGTSEITLMANDGTSRGFFGRTQDGTRVNARRSVSRLSFTVACRS